MMTVKEFLNVAANAEEKHECMVTMPVVGIRFSDRKKEVGDICFNSRHNLDRDNEGDMPVYGTEEYEEMFELDGTSSFNPLTLINMIKSKKHDEKMINVVENYHCYVIGGRYTTNETDALDYGEMVIAEAQILEVIY